MIKLQDLRAAVRGKIVLNENLAPYSSFKIGGNADFFVRPCDKDDVVSAVAFFHQANMPYIILGRGSNILISDEGVRGAVISLRENLEHVVIEGERVYAEAGADLPALAMQTLKQGLGGLENLSGIPGSLGGAILMNAGAYGKEIFEVIEWVEVVRDGKIMRLHKSEIRYTYRDTDLQNDVILATEMRLKKLTPHEQEAAMQRRKEWMDKRRATQPLNLPNAGSIFKNPPHDETGKPRYAGALIEACGLKGARHGNAQISEKHANFIVNLGGAKASDVLALIRLAQCAVKDKFGIGLELEIKLIGFEVKKEGVML